MSTALSAKKLWGVWASQRGLLGHGCVFAAEKLWLAVGDLRLFGDFVHHAFKIADDIRGGVHTGIFLGGQFVVADLQPLSPRRRAAEHEPRNAGDLSSFLGLFVRLGQTLFVLYGPVFNRATRVVGVDISGCFPICLGHFFTDFRQHQLRDRHSPFEHFTAGGLGQRTDQTFHYASLEYVARLLNSSSGQSVHQRRVTGHLRVFTLLGVLVVRLPVHRLENHPCGRWLHARDKVHGHGNNGGAYRLDRFFNQPAGAFWIAGKKLRHVLGKRIGSFLIGAQLILNKLVHRRPLLIFRKLGGDLTPFGFVRFGQPGEIARHGFWLAGGSCGDALSRISHAAYLGAKGLGSRARTLRHGAAALGRQTAEGELRSALAKREHIFAGDAIHR